VKSERARGALSGPIICGQLAAVVTCCLLASCALTSKSEPIVPRYFDLDHARTGAGVASARGTRGPELRLRLGQIEASEHLDERLVFRSKDREIGYYERQRWSERPREYLRRALARELYEQRGLTRVVSGSAPTLEVELFSFEEVRVGAGIARVRLTYVLHDEHSVLIERTLTVDRPVPAAAKRERSSAVVAALDAALQRAVMLVAEQVTSALPSSATAVSPGPPCVPPSTKAVTHSPDSTPRALDPD